MVEQQSLLKDLFAAAWLRTPNDPFKAACLVFGMDTASALRASNEWVSDQYVLAKQAELLAEWGDEYFMPDKLTLARRVWELAETFGKEMKDRLAAYRLYGEIRGFIEKPNTIVGGNVTNNTLVQNRVMVVKDHGTDEEWEQRSVEQQTKLIEQSRN